MKQIDFSKKDNYAGKLQKASQFAYKREFGFTYISIFLSVVFSVVGIFLSSYNYILARQSQGIIEDIEDLNNKINLISVLIKINTLTSGFFILLQVFLKWQATEYHIEAVNFEELYENRLYDIAYNSLILKPIGDVVIEEYSRKMTKLKEKKKKNDEVEENYIEVVTKQKEILENLYHLLRYAKSKFFYLIWYGMIAVIIISSLIYGIDVSYLDVILQILIPSLSILILIINSMKSFMKSNTVINNGLNAMNSVIKEREFKEEEVTESDLRNFQDFIFMQRLSAPMIPIFLQKSFAKYMKKQAETTNNLVTEENHEEKTITMTIISEQFFIENTHDEDAIKLEMVKRETEGELSKVLQVAHMKADVDKKSRKEPEILFLDDEDDIVIPPPENQEVIAKILKEAHSKQTISKTNKPVLAGKNKDNSKPKKTNLGKTSNNKANNLTSDKGESKPKNRLPKNENNSTKINKDSKTLEKLKVQKTNH